jgi:hypothetical protein
MTNMRSIRDNTSKVLSKNNIPIHPYLPLLERASLKSPLEICQRVVALYSLAGLASGAAGDLLKEWLVVENGWGFLSDIEQEKLNSVNLTQEELNELSWKQESLYVLCWCILIIEDLVWPSSEANLSDIFPRIPPEVSVSNFIGSLELRSEEQVIQMLDLYYCLHAAMMHPELWEGAVVSNQLKMEVVLERRQALEWVCSKTVQWDEVSLDT